MQVPKSRALNAPVPKIIIRMPQAPHRKEMRLPKLRNFHELVEIFEKNHPEYESRQLDMVWRKTDAGTYEFGCYFYGRWVKFKGSLTPPEFHLGDVISRESVLKVAVYYLEQTFGKEEFVQIFINEWAPMANYMTNRDGHARIFAYDEENDCIVVKTKEGLTLSIQGSNLIEAAIWLPRMYEQALKNRSRAPEGLETIHIGFGGTEEISIAASPLDMECSVTDYRYLNPHDGAAFDGIINGTFERAFSNRKEA